MGKKLKITFSVMPLVRVEIRGEKHPKGFPYLPLDDGLVARFLAWAREVDLWSARGGTTGPGIYVGYHSPADAKKIRAWLAAEGCAEIEGDGGWRG